MEWLWFVIAAVVVFIVWAGRRAAQNDSTRTFERSGPRSGSDLGGKPAGGKRRAR